MPRVSEKRWRFFQLFFVCTSASSVFELMCFIVYFFCFFVGRDFGRADAIIERMQSQGVRPNRKGRRALALNFCRQDKIERGLHALSLNAAMTEIEWPGMVVAKHLLMVLCQRLDTVRTKTTVRNSLKQLCLVFRSSGREHLTNLIAMAKVSPCNVSEKRLSVGRGDPECVSFLEELGSYLR